jgi:hypothetical protein
MSSFVDHRDLLQIVPLPNRKVIVIVSGCYLNCSRSKGLINKFVGNNWQFSANDWQEYSTPN